jgi:hypothetical protein
MFNKHKVNYLVYLILAYRIYTSICQRIETTNINEFSKNKTSLDIYSQYFRERYSEVVFKKYLIYNTTSPAEVLYVEFEFKEFTQDMKLNSYYKLNVYWFMPQNLKNQSEKGIFYGVSNSKIRSDNSLESDVVICRLVKNIQKRCDDYHMLDKFENNISKSFYTNFTPTLDIILGEGDSILTYEASWLKFFDNNYKTLINFTIYLSTYTGGDSHDLDLDLSNNLTIFYGFFTPKNDDKNSVYFYDPSDLIFNISNLSTINYTELVTISSNFYYVSYFCVVINLIFLIL